MSCGSTAFSCLQSVACDGSKSRAGVEQKLEQFAKSSPQKVETWIATGNASGCLRTFPSGGRTQTPKGILKMRYSRTLWGTIRDYIQASMGSLRDPVSDA